MTDTIAHPRAAARSRWGLLGLAGVAWLVAYRFNPPSWRWLLGDVLGMEKGTRTREVTEFFFYDPSRSPCS